MIQIILALFMVIGLGATDRFYDDIDEQSPDGAYQVTAKSPDNQAKIKRPWQRNFQTVLMRKKDNQILWTKAQGKDESSPVAIKVSNTGVVVITDGSNDLTLVNLDGRERKLGNGLSSISENEVKLYCDFTTAGTFWSQFAVTEFVVIDKLEYFYIRLYWGSYLLFAVDGHQFDKKIVANAIEGELLLKYTKLVNGAKEVMEDCSCCKGKRFRTDLQIGLMVMKCNKVKVLNDNVSKLVDGEDGHWPSIKDYYKKLQ